MPTVAVLPVKSFRMGKGRMAEVLSEETRSRLGRALAERTANLATEVGLIPVLVAGDSEVADWAIHQGLPALTDPGEGLDGAARAGTLWADESASDWMIIHTDLPLLGRGELRHLLEVKKTTGWVLAPSADGGTSVLGGRGAAEFSYGPGSFHRHLGRFAESRIVTRPGLLHDVDTYADLESARRHPRGAWLADLDIL